MVRQINLTVGGPPNILGGSTAKVVVLGDTHTTFGASVKTLVGGYYADTACDLLVHTGDQVYPGGQASDWDTFLLDPYVMRGVAQWIFPTTGQHEWGDTGVGGLTGATVHAPSDGYAPYFAGKGASQYGASTWYYSHDLPNAKWRVIHLCGALNNGSNIITAAGQPIVPVAVGSPQYVWFQQRLQGAATLGYNCLVVFSSPRWATTDSKHSAEPLMDPLWDLMFAELPNQCIVVNSHKHNFEKFDKMSNDGAVDTVSGLTEFVVGTGGAGLYLFTGAAVTGSLLRDDTHWGLLELVLDVDGATWKFINAADGVTLNSGAITLGTPPATVPSPPRSLAAVPDVTSAALTWLAPSSPNGTLQNYQATITPAVALPVIGPTALSANISGLAADTAYTFTLKAVNENGVSTAATVSFRTKVLTGGRQMIWGINLFTGSQWKGTNETLQNVWDRQVASLGKAPGVVKVYNQVIPASYGTPESFAARAHVCVKYDQVGLAAGTFDQAIRDYCRTIPVNKYVQIVNWQEPCGEMLGAAAIFTPDQHKAASNHLADVINDEVANNRVPGRVEVWDNFQYTSIRLGVNGFFWSDAWVAERTHGLSWDVYGNPPPGVRSMDSTKKTLQPITGSDYGLDAGTAIKHHPRQFVKNCQAIATRTGFGSSWGVMEIGAPFREDDRLVITGSPDGTKRAAWFAAYFDESLNFSQCIFGTIFDAEGTGFDQRLVHGTSITNLNAPWNGTSGGPNMNWDPSPRPTPDREPAITTIRPYFINGL